MTRAALFQPLNRSQLARAFGDRPEIIRAWEELQRIVGSDLGARIDDLSVIVQSQGEQISANELAAYAYALGLYQSSKAYSEQLSESIDYQNQIAQLRGEVAQLRKLIDSVVEIP